jgi:DNA primase
MNAHPSASQLAEALAARIDELVPRLLPLARRRGAYWSIGNTDGEPGDSLYVRRHGERAGGWTDTATREFGDALDLVAVVLRLDLRGAMREARGFLGITDGKPWQPPPPSAEVIKIDHGLRAALLEIWRGTMLPQGTAAERYLRNRGITLPLPPSLRFHPRLHYPRSGLQKPCLVAAVSGPDRLITAIQRIYITGNGKKADVSNPKLTVGRLGNGAVRLGAASDRLGIAEGLETGLSAMQVFGVPVWCALGTRLDGVAIPDTVTVLAILADNDDPGRRAAERAVHAHERLGRTVEVRYPPHGLKDWNDAL